MKQIFRSIVFFLTTLLFTMSIIFFCFRLTPGDPVERILGPDATQLELDNYRNLLGLNLPLQKQYFNFMSSAIKGEFGESLFNKRPVTSLLKERLSPTFVLAILSIIISTFIGIFTGIIAAYKKDKFIDKILRPISLIILALPVFCLAPLLVILFSIKLRLLPVSEWGDVRHLILPLLTLVLPLSAVLMRVTRNKLLEEKNAQWLIVLKAKGLKSHQIILRHLKISLPTILNMVAMQFSVVLAGAMITETIYDIPGMGTLLFEGIQNRDYPLVQGIVIYSTCISLFIYLFIESFNSKVDPRIEIN